MRNDLASTPSALPPLKPCPHCLGTGTVLADPARTLSEARSSAGLSQAALANRLGVSTTYVSDVDRGARPISAARAKQWLAECGVETLWTRETNETKGDTE